MNSFRNIAVTLVAGATLLASAAPSFAKSDMKSDMGRFTKGPTYMGSPQLPTTLSLVVAGGGPTSFDSTKLVGVLAGDKTSAEVASLTQKFGADNVKSFLTVFDFVINDSLAKATAANVALPSAPNPSPADGKALAASLYTLGVVPATKQFDVEYMLDGLVSHPIHVAVMNDIDAKYGKAADANYHAVLTQAMTDLKSVYML